MEYQCFYLSPNYQLSHENDAEILFESDNLAEAGDFIYRKWLEEKRDIAVYQPRTEGYREIYRNPSRDPKGKFCKR